MTDQRKATFSKQELERYSRHLIIPEFNIEGQRRLKEAKVLVVGSGGLGAPLLLYLTAAGVGKIGIVDFDVVEDSNLQRQVLFQVDDLGKPKVEVAINRLQGLNPHIEFEGFQERLTSTNALEIISDYDLVADGTDNFPTRYLVNDACVLLGKPNVYASIFRFEGQVSVFNYDDGDGNGNIGPNYRDIFPAPPPPGMVPSCAEGGVLGVLPGIIGSLQANEVIKVITGIGQPLSGKLHLFDALTFESRTVNFGKDPKREKITELIDYEDFCGLNSREDALDISSISVEELQSLIDTNQQFQLIDVREPYEYEIANLGGELIPQSSIEDQINKINKEGDVIVHCRSGVRSKEVIKLLRDNHGYQNLRNLEGGILAWAQRIDPAIPQY